MEDAPATMDYVLKHGITHLVAAGRHREARALLLENVAWLMARSADGLGVMEDCRRLVAAAGESGDRTVDLVRRALDLSMPDLRKDPRRLPGQLVGRLMGSGASGSAGADGNPLSTSEIGGFLKRLKEYQGYGFAWWCPVSRTLEQAGGACLRKITGHTSMVTSVSFSVDGSRIVSGSDDKTVRVWDAVSGECVLGPLEGHTSWVRPVSFCGDGSRIVSGSGDETVRVWDAVSGECVHVVEDTAAIPSDIPVAQASSARRDMSVVKQDAPIGMELNRAYIHGSRACALEVDLLDDDGEATGKKKFINKSEVAVDVDTSE
eukprot:g2175.t1